jgi:hypothetical protein
MRQNGIHGEEAGKVFSNMLAQNTVLKELDLSSQKVGNHGHALDADFAKEFAVGISDNGALTSLNLADNRLCGMWTEERSQRWGTFDSSGLFSVHAAFNGD